MRSQLDELNRMLPVLRNAALPAQSALLLSRVCFIHALTFALRILPPSVTGAVAREYSRVIQDLNASR